MILTVLIHDIVHIVYNLWFWFFYHFEFDFIERYKTNTDPWPWYQNEAEWKKLVKKSVALFLFNTNVTLPTVYFILSSAGLLPNFKTSVEDIPDLFTLAATVLFCMFVEDSAFYLSHRLLHHPKLYPYIHKLHHQHNTSIGIAADYSHPIEFAILVMLTGLGPRLLGENVHLLTVFTWYIVRAAESFDGHCGYEFSWSPYRLIPFSGSAEYHDFHHSANVGNFGSFFSIWDSFFGTNQAYYKMLEMRQEPDKKTI